MNILCACEHSQRVTEQLRLLGHNAFSCDILPASGSMPEYHLQGDLDSFVTFKPNNTVADYDKRFRLEDELLIFPDDSCFRWNWLDGNIQLKFFA